MKKQKFVDSPRRIIGEENYPKELKERMEEMKRRREEAQKIGTRNRQEFRRR